jgi:anti-anti-sigma factor
MTDRFRATVHPESSPPVIELIGQIDAEAATALLDAWQRVAPAADRVILDFSGTDYINSTGLAVIVQVLALARASGTALVAIGLTDHYREIFQITRLSDFLTIEPDMAAALA